MGTTAEGHDMDVRMSAEIEAALGPQMAAEARSASRNGGSCIHCQKPLDPAGTTNVVVGRAQSSQGGAVWYAHAACGRSEIISLPDEAVTAIMQPEDGHDMQMTPLMLPNGPALVATISGKVMSDGGNPGSDVVSIYVSGLLDQGFQLIANPEAAVAPLDGWHGTLAPYGRDFGLVIADTNSQRFYDGTLARIPDWSTAVLQQRHCTLLAGDVEVQGKGLNDTPPEDRHDAVTAAAHEGRLAGARISMGRLTR